MRAGTAKKRTRRRKHDPLEREIELALNPGGFIHDRACYSFVTDLERTAAQVASLTKADAARAAALYETFLAGCYEKVNELDDSSGSFGQFVHRLLCEWIGARQSMAADPDATVDRLLAWMGDDPYALSYGVEKDAVKAFNKAGMSAFERQVRERFEAAVSERSAHAADAERARRECGEILRTIAGLAREWATTVDEVRARHRRKVAFISGFERLAAGARPRQERSFLERAKARWSKR